MIFVDIPTDRIQHKFFVYFIGRAVIESSEIIIFLDISKMSFRLNGTDLAVQDTFFALNICVGSFF